MLALIITIAVAVMTLAVCLLAEYKEDIYEEINEKSNSKK